MIAHRSQRLAMILVALLIPSLGAGPASAQDNARVLRGQIVATPMTPQMSQQLSTLFQTGEEPKAFPFTVPANFETMIRCVPGPNGLQCAPVITRMECPSQVTFEDPTTGQSVTVDVTCSGLDSQSDCDCDFK